ncbi:MAG: sensor histidine kinase, partial [Turicibacter sp.]
NALLSRQETLAFEQEMDLNVIEYAVINFSDDATYGTLNVPMLDKNLVINNLNTTEYVSPDLVRRYIPLQNEEKDLEGCLVLAYPLKMLPRDKMQAIYFSAISVILVSPFIVFAFFMWLFGRNLSKNITIPLQKLSYASKKITSQDLEFTVEYAYDNELGEVIQSFDKMRETLKITLKRQWEIEQQQKDLVAALAHDLRTPLTLIKGHVELLMDGAYKQEARLLKYLNVMDRASDRATLLVEDLNLLSQIDNGTFRLNKSLLKIGDYFSEKISDYESLIQVKGLSLAYTLDEQLVDKLMEIDPLRFSQVIDNIMTNACRYAPASSQISMCISCEGDSLHVRISDEGIGFSAEDLKYAFDKFYRGDVSRSKQDANSGLGLFICKEIIELHGGTISLTNATLSGAIVDICLNGIIKN